MSISSGLNISVHLDDVLGRLDASGRSSETGVSRAAALWRDSTISSLDAPIEEDFEQLRSASLEKLDRKSLSFKAVLPVTQPGGRKVRAGRLAVQQYGHQPCTLAA